MKQFAAPLEVETGQTILEAALAQGLPYPHGCRSGNCGACKSEMFDGDVDLMPHSEFALTPGERAAGKILACRAVPWSNCSVAFLDEGELVVHPQRHATASIVGLARLTHDIVGLRLHVTRGGPFTFSAGQYAALAFAGLAPRDFSMANVPTDEVLEFHIRLLPGGTASRYAAERAHAGETLRLRGPFGTSYLRERHTGPMLLAGGGTGLAPMLSILETALHQNPARDVTLYVGARDERDLYAADRIDPLMGGHRSLIVHRVLSQPVAPTTYRTGFLAAAIERDLIGADVDGLKAYLAGPPIMTETVTAALEAAGVARHDIHADAFFAASASAPTEAVS